MIRLLLRADWQRDQGVRWRAAVGLKAPCAHAQSGPWNMALTAKRAWGHAFERMTADDRDVAVEHKMKAIHERALLVAPGHRLVMPQALKHDLHGPGVRCDSRATHRSRVLGTRCSRHES